MVRLEKRGGVGEELPLRRQDILLNRVRRCLHRPVRVQLRLPALRGGGLKKGLFGAALTALVLGLIVRR
jgi:hypothetical protein